jgi:hypothetical protein
MVNGLPEASPLSEFDKHVEESLARTKKTQDLLVLQMAVASLESEAIQRTQKELGELREDAKVRETFKLSDIPRQLELAVPLITNLGLDRSSPLKILGLDYSQAGFLFCAKVLGHQVVACCRNNAAYDRLLALYGLPNMAQANLSDLPDDEFHVVATGRAAFGSESAWSSFIEPRIRKLASGGRFLFTLAKRPIPDRNFDPEAALSMFERLGAQVSHANYSVVLDKEQAAALRSQSEAGELPKRTNRTAARPAGAPPKSALSAVRAEKPPTPLDVTDPKPATSFASAREAFSEPRVAGSIESIRSDLSESIAIKPIRSGLSVRMVLFLLAVVIIVGLGVALWQYR